jgi:hypothetical protein
LRTLDGAGSATELRHHRAAATWHGKREFLWRETLDVASTGI